MWERHKFNLYIVSLYIWTDVYQITIVEITRVFFLLYFLVESSLFRLDKLQNRLLSLKWTDILQSVPSSPRTHRHKRITTLSGVIWQLSRLIPFINSNSWDRYCYDTPCYFRGVKSHPFPPYSNFKELRSIFQFKNKTFEKQAPSSNPRTLTSRYRHHLPLQELWVLALITFTS